MKSVVNIDIETLLKDYHADCLVVTFGNQNHEEKYLELMVEKSVVADQRIFYRVKEPSEAGEINHTFATPVYAGSSLEEIRQNYVNAGLIEDRGPGSWNKLKTEKAA
jgi:hypothetical protein